MYSWDDGTDDWARGGYVYGGGAAARKARDEAASRAAASGPRTYRRGSGPNAAIVDPTKRIVSRSKTPMIVAVDVTGSMSTWPAEIFDRLPLFYNTLAQYRPDLELSFAAIGDAGCDSWPLQVTDFSKGYDLEQLLKGIWGEGGGGDEPESYGLFAQYVRTHVEVPNALKSCPEFHSGQPFSSEARRAKPTSGASSPREARSGNPAPACGGPIAGHASSPFLIVFGDAPMHPQVRRREMAAILGDRHQQRVDSIQCFQELCRTWNVWFVRRPTGRSGDHVEKQWARAIGAQKILQIDDELRGVDYAMGLVARHWGHFDDFQGNMKARQTDDRVATLADRIEKAVAPLAVSCPKCSAPLPLDEGARVVCKFCGTPLIVPAA